MSDMNGRDLMLELQDYLELLAKQPREWHDENSPDLKFFSAHTTPSGGIILKPLDMPRFAEQIIQIDPRDTMRLFPEALHRWHDAIPREIGETFFAWVARTEAFSLEVSDDLPDLEQRFKAARERTIEQHADRIEVRDWNAASADGTHFGVLAEKETGEVRRTTIIRPGSDLAKKASKTINARSLIRAARVTEWALGRWPRR